VDWIIAILAGAVVGWAASLVMKTDARPSAVANVVVGVIGASLGFWAVSSLGLFAGSTVAGWGAGVIGAVLLILLVAAFGIFREE
jgi:uncharacterized membrane protein YeaQ/YmgE (transglycosylase-associated protein family)